ncbi:MAG: hypothetical protein ACE5JM_05425, partial [Armatimonadota bacterium]
MSRSVRAPDEGLQLERGLLLLASGVMVAGFLLASLAMGQSAVRTVRVLIVPGAFLLVSLATNDSKVRRDRLVLPIVAMLCGIGICSLWHVNELLMAKQLLWITLGAAVMVGTFHMLPEPRQLAR